MIGNEDDGHGRIGNVLGASFSLLRLLFFADPPTAEMLSHFDRKFGPRASNKSGVSATAPRLFELVDRSNPSNSTGWILVDADQGRGGFFKSRPALADSIAVERYTEPRRAPRVLRNRLTRLFALLQTKRPEDPEVVAWKLHAEEAIRQACDPLCGKRYAAEFLEMFLSVERGADPDKELESHLNGIARRTTNYSLPIGVARQLVLCIATLKRIPDDVKRIVLGRSMKALLTTGDPKSLDDTKIVYGVLKPMLSFQQGFDTLNAACCTLRDEGDAIFKSVRDMPKYSRFAQALFTAGCPYGAAMLGFDLLSTIRQGEELAKLEAARDFCDERIARIGAVLAIGHAALYDRAVMQSFRNHVSAAYTQSEDAGNQAVFDITSRNLFFPKSWTPFLCKKTDFLPLV